MIPRDPERRYYWWFFLRLDLVLIALLALLYALNSLAR